ncbi:cysteine-rich CWC family protein [Marinicrinis lubricantis]
MHSIRVIIRIHARRIYLNRTILSEDEKRCPLCLQLNDCRVHQEDCWCFHTKVPVELRLRIPEDRRGKSCICKKCVDAFYDTQSSKHPV